MNNGTDQNTIHINKYQIFFNKLLTSRVIKIQIDVLTKKTIKANCLKILLCLGGIAGTGLMIYNFIYPNTTVKSDALVATGAGNILNKTITLINGTSSVLHISAHGTLSKLHHGNQQTGILNNESKVDFNDLYEINPKFRDEIIDFVGDKAGLTNEQILDKRYKYNTLNKLGMKILAGFACSSDYTEDLIEILSCYK